MKTTSRRIAAFTTATSLLACIGLAYAQPTPTTPPSSTTAPRDRTTGTRTDGSIDNRTGNTSTTTGTTNTTPGSANTTSTMSGSGSTSTGMTGSTRQGSTMDTNAARDGNVDMRNNRADATVSGSNDGETGNRMRAARRDRN